MSKFLVLTATLSLFSCSTPMDLGPMSEHERLPDPMFLAYAPDEMNQRGVFTDIRVFERRKECTPPHCPLKWHVSLNRRQSPTMFRYGNIPGFGLNTLRSQQPLRPNTEYVLLLTEKSPRGEDVKGELIFRVDDQGIIVPVEESEEN